MRISLVLVALALLLAVGVVAVVAGAMMLRRSRGAGIAIIATGVLVVVTPIAFLASQALNGPSHSTIWVDGLRVAEEPGLEIELDHGRHGMDGNSYAFAADLAPGDLIDELNDQYPGWQAQRDGWWLEHDGVVYALTYDGAGERRHMYTLAVQVASVDPGKAGGVRIPFPVDALGRTSFLSDEVLPVGLNIGEFAAFYSHTPGVARNGDTFTVRTDGGGTAAVTVADGTATVTLIP